MSARILAIVVGCAFSLYQPLSVTVAAQQDFSCKRTGGANRWTLQCERVADPGGTPSTWTRQGTGPRVFAIPPRVKTVRITAHNQTGSNENFVVWCGRDNPNERGGLWANELLRANQRWQTTAYNVREYNGRGIPCRQVTVKYSVGVRWTMTQQEDASGLVPRERGVGPEMDEWNVLQNRRAVLNELLRER